MKLLVINKWITISQHTRSVYKTHWLFLEFKLLNNVPFIISAQPPKRTTYIWPWVKVTQSCPTLCNPMDFSRPWNHPGHNTRVNSFSFLQGIFPTQGLIPGLLHCREDSLPAEPPGKTKYAISNINNRICMGKMQNSNKRN